MIPRLGYLCLSENPTQEAGRALIRQFVLVREADRMGYDDIWLGEQHDDPTWPQGAAIALLGHLAAVTSKARIGSLVLQPALREARALAEDVATLDLLSKGRFDLGAGSGAAFPAALALRGLDAAGARVRMRATLDAALALLDGSAGSQALEPRPGQSPVPGWMAADDETSLRWAAERGWGLVAAATHTRDRVQRALEIYTRAANGRTPALTLARFGCSADTRQDALAMAEPYFASLVARADAAGWGRDRSRSIARDAQALVDESLIGSHAEVARAFQALGASFGATHVAVVPTSGQFDNHKHILAAFVDEVRPLFDE